MKLPLVILTHVRKFGWKSIPLSKATNDV